MKFGRTGALRRSDGRGTVDQPRLAVGGSIRSLPTVLKLTDVVDTWAAQTRRDPSDRQRGARSASRRLAIIRQTYHFGPQKIAMYLRRYHELVVSGSGICGSCGASA